MIFKFLDYKVFGISVFECIWCLNDVEVNSGASRAAGVIA